MIDKVKGLVDEINEIVGVALFVMSVVFHQLDYISMEMMFNGFAVAGGVYLGVKSFSKAGTFVQLLLEKMKSKDDETDEESGEDGDGEESE